MQVIDESKSGIVVVAVIVADENDPSKKSRYCCPIDREPKFTSIELKARTGKWNRRENDQARRTAVQALRQARGLKT